MNKSVTPAARYVEQQPKQSSALAAVARAAREVAPVDIPAWATKPRRPRVRITRRPQVDTIICALMENEQTGDVVVCMPEQDITAAGAEALGDTLTTWLEAAAPARATPPPAALR